MSIITTLRSALQQGKQAKDASRQAGEGFWANYVRATMLDVERGDLEAFQRRHDQTVSDLNAIQELSKDEKNSLRSAKSVVGKAVTNNVDVWQRDDSGFIVCNEQGEAMPKGKSELQDAKSDFDRLCAFLDGFEKKFGSDTRDSLTAEELEVLKGKFLTISAAVGEEYSTVVGQ
jgi:hypothetical protein